MPDTLADELVAQARDTWRRCVQEQKGRPESRDAFMDHIAKAVVAATLRSLSEADEMDADHQVELTRLADQAGQVS